MYKSFTLTNGEHIEVNIRRNARAKRLIIKVFAKTKEVRLILPKKTTFKQAIDFLTQHEIWVRNKLIQYAIPTNSDSTINFNDGSTIPVLGTPHLIKYMGLRGITQIKDGEIHVFGLIEHIEKKVKNLLSELLLKEINIMAKTTSNRLNVNYKKITVRNMISRWGSCTSKGSLNFSTYLVLAPRNIIEYVIIHEVCHLIEFNHSKKFWDLVSSLCPYYLEAKKWLKTHGKSLM